MIKIDMKPLKVLFLSSVFVFGMFLFTSNVNAAPITVSCSGTPGSPTAVVESNLTGNDVTFSNGGGNGYCELNLAVSANTVTVGTGVVLTHDIGGAVGVSITTVGNMSLEGTAIIDVTSKGDVGGDSLTANGIGTGGGIGATISVQGGGGAGYGGAGGSSASGNAGGIIYGTADNPTLYGSGGGRGYGYFGAPIYGNGGNGGGKVLLNVGGTLSIGASAQILAEGGDGLADSQSQSSGGGGSGGSIKISTVALSGTGVVSTNGGNSATATGSQGGGGGGGRVYISHSGSSTFSGSVTSAGGSGANAGANGTAAIYDSTNNNIIITDGFDLLSTSSPYTYGTVSISGAASKIRLFGVSSAISLTAATVTDAGSTTYSCEDAATTFTYIGSTSLDIDNSTWTGCDNLSVTRTPNTPLTVTGMTMTSATGSITLDLSDELTLINSSVTTTTAKETTIITSATSFTLTNTNLVTNIPSFTTQTMVIDASSSINANALGDAGGTELSPNGVGAGGGIGATGNYLGGGGGGYGGAGGTGGPSGTIAGGVVHGTSTDPIAYGSGGGLGRNYYSVPTYATGGKGGGLISLTATTSFTMNGAISADGADGVVVSNTSSSGGGSGGGIKIVAGAFSGTTGSFSADGGSGPAATDQGGGGGGGRVHVEAVTNSSSFLSGLSAATVVIGGTGYTSGSNGTLSVVDIAPTLSSSRYEDSNGDGTIDQIVLTFSEPITLGGTLANTRFTFVSATGANGFGGSLTGNATASGTDLTVLVSGAEAGDTGHVIVPTIAYDDNTNDAIDKIQDAGGGIVQTFTAQNITDSASPMLSLSSPANSDVGVAANSSIVFTFTEPISTGTFAYTCCGAGDDPGRAGAWTSSNSVYTVSPTVDWTLGDILTFDITVAVDASGNVFNGATSLASDPFSFTVVMPRGGGVPSPGAGPDAVVTTAMLLTPNGGESLIGNGTYSITWLASSDNLDTVSIFYSNDGGQTYTLVASGEANDGAYAWTVPNEASTTARVRVDAVNSSGSVLASDASNANFSVASVAETVVPTPETSEPETTGPLLTQMTKPNGEELNVLEGSLFRGVTLSDVYVVKNGARYVFPSEDVFLSYYNSFSGIVQVNDDQLREIPFGGRMTMASGQLIKIQSDAKVYVVQDDGSVRHIPDEATAIAMYGSDWAGLVNDISVVFWFDYPQGDALPIM